MARKKMARQIVTLYDKLWQKRTFTETQPPFIEWFRIWAVWRDSREISGERTRRVSFLKIGKNGKNRQKFVRLRPGDGSVGLPGKAIIDPENQPPNPLWKKTWPWTVWKIYIKLFNAIYNAIRFICIPMPYFDNFCGSGICGLDK